MLFYYPGSRGRLTSDLSVLSALRDGALRTICFSGYLLRAR